MNVVVKNIPEDLRKVIIREQAKEKENRGVHQFSLSSTIIKMLREWQRCLDKNRE